MKSAKYGMAGLALAIGLAGTSMATQGALEEPAEAGRTVRKEFPATSGQRLTVELKCGGRIEVSGWDRDAVSVEAVREGTDWSELDVSIEPSASGVEIGARAPRYRRRFDADLLLRVQVPRRFDLDLETMGGDLVLLGLEGRFDGRSMGGDLKLSELKGHVDLTTMGGDIELRSSDLEGRLKTMGGEVLFEDVIGDVRGSSMGGSVILKNVQRRDGSSTGKETRIRTMGGDIDVAEAPAGADLHTMGGDIRVRKAKGHVEAKTMGGNIDLDSVEGWIRATTMGGDIEAKMTGDPAAGRRDVRLVSMSGDVTLEVPEGLSMEIEIELATTRGHDGRYQIVSDFPLTRTDERDWDTRRGSARRYARAAGSVAGGRNKIVLETVNGNVTLRKAGS